MLLFNIDLTNVQQNSAINNRWIKWLVEQSFTTKLCDLPIRRIKTYCHVTRIRNFELIKSDTFYSSCERRHFVLGKFFAGHFPARYKICVSSFPP